MAKLAHNRGILQAAKKDKQKNKGQVNSWIEKRKSACVWYFYLSLNSVLGNKFKQPAHTAVPPAVSSE